MKKTTAFSLIEVIVAAVVFAVSLACIFGAVRSTANRPVAQNVTDVRGALYGQAFLDSLRSEVTANCWNDSTSSLADPKTDATIPFNPSFPGYSGIYNVEDVNGARKVSLRITTP